MSSLFNFAIDFVAITTAKSSEELSKYVELASKTYPHNNEDNACILALCMNVNLSIEQMLVLGKKYGKYIKQNPNYAISMLGNDFNSIKNIDDSYYGIYKDIIDFNHQSKPYISYGDFIDYKIIEETNDVDFVKSIFYFEEIVSDSVSSVQKYVASKNLKKINAYFFNSIKKEFIKAFIDIYIFGLEAIYNNEKYPNLLIQEEDYSLLRGDFIFEQFKNKLKDFPISWIGKLANRALELILKCTNEVSFYSARDIVMLALAHDSGFCLNNDNKNIFEGRIQKIIETFNSI